MGKERDKRTNHQCLDDLLAAIGDLEKELAALRTDGETLNVFEVLDITNTEIRHSNVIAWLMRPKGSHGLGGSVLSALVEKAGGSGLDSTGDFRIMRESDNIDILAVSADNHVTLAIENKVWSGEHDDQLSRYQGIVERRYPGWEHLYLFLSPFGTPPEGEADRGSWVPIDYRTLLGVIEGAVEDAEIPDKARMLIGDYVDSVRRHIVGDESLQERCVEIYLEHKRAIDLIMKNLPDTTKTVHQYVLEWAHRLPGVRVVDECSRGKQYVRFRTRRLEEHFPPVNGTDNWGQQHFWFYEVISRPAKDGVGCDLSLQICFHLPKKPPLSEERIAKSHEFTDAFSAGSNDTFHGTWTGYCVYVTYLSAGDYDYDSLAEICDESWDDFMRREEHAIAAIFG